MEITRVKLSELRHDDRNARKHDERNIEEIKRSITAFGQHRPFVVQRGTNKVIVGNGMLDAMLALGMTEGDAYFVDDNDEKSIRRALADNRTGELAEWDMGTLKDLFQDMGPEPDVQGWDLDEIQDLFDWHDTGTGTESEIEEDEVPEVQEEAVSQLGDIWLLDKHRLMCGDSTKENDVAALMGGIEADMAFTDPPWNVDYGNVKSNNRQGYKPHKILNDSMPTEQFKGFLDATFCTMKHSLRGGGMSAQEWGNLMSSMASSGFHWASTIIWKKDIFVLSRKD